MTQFGRQWRLPRQLILHSAAVAARLISNDKVFIRLVNSVRGLLLPSIDCLGRLIQRQRVYHHAETAEHDRNNATMRSMDFCDVVEYAKMLPSTLVIVSRIVEPCYAFVSDDVRPKTHPQVLVRSLLRRGDTRIQCRNAVVSVSDEHQILWHVIGSGRWLGRICMTQRAH